jgi:asparagine synthetase B (glutamine-hydrolysing)
MCGIGGFLWLGTGPAPFDSNGERVWRSFNGEIYNFSRMGGELPT